MKIYLECTKDSSSKFWEIEVQGASHTVCYGPIGEHGQQRTKTFTTPEAALKDAQRLIASKRKKGYEELAVAGLDGVVRPAPEMLGGDPLPQEQVELFTCEAITAGCNHAEHKKRWTDLFKGLCRETIYDSEERTKRLPSDTALAQEFETIASWDSPSMAKSVERDAQGMVVEIQYRINGQLVLSLRNRSNDHWGHQPVVPFFLMDEGNGLVFGRRERIVEGTRLLLERFPAFGASHIPGIAEKVDMKVKEEKMKAVAEANIPIMVEELMKGTAYRYNLEEGAKSSLLRVALEGKRYVELSLSHKTFVKRMADVLPTLEAAKLLRCELREMMGFPFKLGNKDMVADWGQTYLWELSPVKDDEIFGSIYFKPRLVEYLEQTLYSGPGRRGRLDLEALLKLEIQGLEVEPKYYKGKIDCVEYSLDGKCVLTVYDWHVYFENLFDTSVNLHTGDDNHRLEEYALFLNGYADFARTLQEGYAEALHEAQKLQKVRIIGQNSIEAAMRSVMNPTGYVYALDLHGSDVPYPALLHVQMKQRKVFSLGFSYESFTEKLESIVPAIELVARTMEASKLQFKMPYVPDKEFDAMQWQGGE